MMERILIAEGGVLDYDSSFLPTEESDRLFHYLQSNVSWEQKYYTHRKTGAQYPQPRLTAWFADDNKMAYSYSGVTQKVQPWLPNLLELKAKIEEATQAKYNSVLLNYYRTGNDSVGLHADDERELSINANIASISLGATRKFILHQYRSKDGRMVGPSYYEYMLAHGSLLVMSGSTQHYWKHEIPKVDKSEPRINLTFRYFYQL
jgi:alkylated DNA repair dioxygenase AlkB